MPGGESSGGSRGGGGGGGGLRLYLRFARVAVAIARGPHAPIVIGPPCIYLINTVYICEDTTNSEEEYAAGSTFSNSQ